MSSSLQGKETSAAEHRKVVRERVREGLLCLRIGAQLLRLAAQLGGVRALGEPGFVHPGAVVLRDDLSRRFITGYVARRVSHSFRDARQLERQELSLPRRYLRGTAPRCQPLFGVVVP